MERPMSIVTLDETTPAPESDPPPEDTALAGTTAAEMPRTQQPVKSPARRLHDAEARSPSDDHPMRLPFFDESCPHVRDQIIPMNGGHFNVDHYLRVLRARLELDVSIAMALTAAGQQKTAPALSHRLSLVGRPHHLGGAP